MKLAKLMCGLVMICFSFVIRGRGLVMGEWNRCMMGLGNEVNGGLYEVVLNGGIEK